MTDNSGWIDPSFDGSFCRFPNPGDAYVGIVEAYDPEGGAQNYNRDGEVGCLKLATADGPMLLALDRPNLRREVQRAMRRAEQNNLWGADAEPYSLMMLVRFVDWGGSGQKRYKAFKVLIRPATEDDQIEMSTNLEPAYVDELEAPF